MRLAFIRKNLVAIAAGGCLWLSCPSGTGQFLGPIVQPVLTQFFSELANALTGQILGADQTP
jgi:hypothetical protein